MKILYLECNMGAAGDMLMAALSELVDAGQFLAEINQIGLDGVQVEREARIRCGIAGTGMRVHIHGEEEQVHEHHHEHPHQHEHSHEHLHEHEHSHDGHQGGLAGGMTEILHLISHLNVSEQVKKDATAVYTLLAEAESKVHQMDMAHIHFHEVGSLDAIVDIVGVCMLMEKINPDQVIVSPVATGSGQVQCAHGVLPVPAPATAELLQGVPAYSGAIKGELCTPTGAALLKHFADHFGSRPVMITTQTGYGMGKKEFSSANCVRAFLGSDMAGAAGAGPNDEVIVLSCNLDDMTGEAIGFASEVLLAEGALDVYTIPIQMKKSRPGQMLSCICRTEDADRLAALILKHTTSFGVRKLHCERYRMDVRFETTETGAGAVKIKHGSGYGVAKSKPEYEDMAELARKTGRPINGVLE